MAPFWCSFNSTMVRLKVDPVTGDVRYLLMFQFHNGSIKRRSVRFCNGIRKRFNSTMVRLKSTKQIDGAPCAIRFNSTMVRLKADGFREFRYFGIGFNSTMVRLKDMPPLRLQHQLQRFNSTMVRLKAIGISLRRRASS